ncbi:MAG: hypothetical protein P8105_04420 [Dehalococcoidia bacterium]
MTKVTINPGVCGMTCTIEVSRVDRRQVNLSIDTKCEMLRKITEELAVLNLHEVLKPAGKSIVYESAGGAGTHAACPVPMAIIKAVEVETGMALPRPVSLVFESPD